MLPDTVGDMIAVIVLWAAYAWPQDRPGTRIRQFLARERRTAVHAATSAIARQRSHTATQPHSAPRTQKNPRNVQTGALCITHTGRCSKQSGANIGAPPPVTDRPPKRHNNKHDCPGNDR